MTEKTVRGLHAHLFNILETHIVNAEDRSILDIGCGAGAYLDRVKLVGFNRMVGIVYVQPKLVSGLELARFKVNHDTPNKVAKYCHRV